MRLVVVASTVLVACSSMPPGVVTPISPPPEDAGPGPCAGQTCGGHGRCAVVDGTTPVCLCDAGFRAEGTTCVEVSDAGLPGVCDGLDCSGHGQCAVVDGSRAVCLCDAGFRAEGTACVAVVTGQECQGVTCSGRGTCVVLQGPPPAPSCRCEAGFREVGGTTCVANADPCAGVTCSGAGTCAVRGGVDPVCLCAPGFVASGPRACVAVPDAGPSGTPFDGGGTWPAVDGGLDGCTATYSVLASGLSELAQPIGPGPGGVLYVVDPLTDSDGFRTYGVTVVAPGQAPRRLFDSSVITQARRNATHFYLIAQVGTTRGLFRAPLTGATPTRVPGTTPTQAVSSVFPLDAVVYWTRTDAQAPVTTDLMRTDPSTLVSTVVRRLPDFAVLVHADATHVYFTTRLEVGRLRLSDNTLQTLFSYPELRIPESLVFEGNDVYLLEDSILPTVRVLKLNLAVTPPTTTVLVSETPAMSGRRPYQLDVGQSTLTLAFLQGGQSSYATAPKSGGPMTVIPGTANAGLSTALVRVNQCQTFWHVRNRATEVAWRLDPP
ncbi:MAG: hypothetical protein MUC96_13240 [Myxococcaceae bacterium]|jgi:hypothetical protein|nr:hypothetical protein [Myxococcaceae bacterium]